MLHRALRRRTNVRHVLRRCFGSRDESLTIGLQDRKEAPIVWHPGYSVPWPETHRFAMWKFDDLANHLVKRGQVVQSFSDFVRPEPAREDEVLLVHDNQYYRDFVGGTLSTDLMRRTGFQQRPSHSDLVSRTLLEVGGTILSCRLALSKGMALHCAGGTHHAHRAYGSGYTCFNDAAVAARVMQREGLAKRVLIVDVDVHQGDGTAEIFSNDPSVFTLSLHCETNFPFGFSNILDYLGNDISDLDVPLPPNTNDDEYMHALRTSLPKVLDEFRPCLVVYNGGIDVFAGDALGKLSVTEAGIAARDRYALSECVRRGVAVATVIGGGYDRNREALAARHGIVIREGAKVFQEFLAS